MHLNVSLDENDSHIAPISIWFPPFSLFLFCESQVRVPGPWNRTIGHRSLPVILRVWVLHENPKFTRCWRIVSINTRQRRIIMQPTPTTDHLTPLPARPLCVPLLCRALVAALHSSPVSYYKRYTGVNHVSCLRHKKKRWTNLKRII